MGGSVIAEGTAQRTAREAQRIGSEPGVSAFVGASAGSGKTKLLTDRLLRLMLAGTPPERILCLTFTRAAAAEMALRLQRRLGEWVTMADPALDARLAELGLVPDGGVRKQARALFAEVLDLPGGMRIGTIHAFCQSVLRRFPLEAALSPHFELEAEEDAVLALEEAERRAVAGAGADARVDGGVIERLAPVVGSLERLGRLMAGVVAGQARFERLRGLPSEARSEAFRNASGAPKMPPDRAAVAEEEALREALAAIAERGSPAMASRAGSVLAWLDHPAPTRRADFPDWCNYFLTGMGLPRKPSAMINSRLAADEPALAEILAGEQRRLQELLAAEVAGRSAALSEDLFSLALPVLDFYGEEKARAGRLDYGDLIRHTRRLLDQSGAAWVLHKLDGGIDHLLLDEAQDTAPEQWAIADALSAEFFAGRGAREVPRTFFAVGDPKQSIFSFQGADPAGFERWRDRLRARVAAAGEGWQEPALEVSFRSTAPVLALVDAVFADPASPAGVVPSGRPVRHDPVRVGQAGAVELWPLAPASDPPAAEPWTVPAENLNQSQVTAPIRLAGALAAWIREKTAGAARLESRNRPLGPGDVLVLVRRRNVFSRALVRALKAGGVPVAGLDRLQLAEEPAVQDLQALCRALLLPEDDLTFANFLVSPLGGLADEDLMALCPRRERPLFEVLAKRAGERPAWRTAADLFAALRARADYVSAHALLVEVLGPLGGRARLYARLGVEAGEALDELLNAALRHAKGNVPSLQAFLYWLDHAGAEVKREATEAVPEAAGGVVRVMTVHGAKGLQAPLVILPDTTGLPPESEALLAGRDPATGAEVPLFAPNAEYHSPVVARLRAERRRAALEEHNRLLYVALTRAEDLLVVAGWEMRRSLSEECWYRLVERGFARLAAERKPFLLGWEGERLSLEAPQLAPPEVGREAGRAAAQALPEWAGRAPDWRARPPPPEPSRPDPLAPSRPEGAELGAPPPAASPLLLRDAEGRRFRRGQLVHAALQHLPQVPERRREEAVRRFFARAGQELSAEEAASLTGAVLAVLAHPDLARLFGPEGRAEVPLTGMIGENVVGGLVDRLAVLPDRVLVADFKTNRRPPASVAETPALYLRQMALYRAVLRAIFPDRPVEAALVWTETGRVDRLPDALLERHNPGSTAAGTSPA
ncbi:MAG: double-strand break repair helicase AddA [Rhodospirillales bacterium]|nr:double-strand break repair helicase AddA [Rhodospirillales bacterium]